MTQGKGLGDPVEDRYEGERIETKLSTGHFNGDSLTHGANATQSHAIASRIDTQNK